MVGSVRRGRTALGWLVFVAALAGCGDASTERSARPSDGLLERPELQTVVEMQNARDVFGLMDALEDPVADVRARAAFALGTVQDAQAVDRLSRLLEDEVAAVRRDAAFALGRTGDPAAISAIAMALESERDSGARREMIRALGFLPVEESADVLLGLPAGGADEVVRTGALARLGGRYGLQHLGLRDHLFAAVESEDAAVRYAASTFFSQLGGTRLWGGRAVLLRPVLDGYAPDDPAAMHLALGLGMLRDFLDNGRLRALADSAPDWRVRAGAMTYLDPMSPSSTVLARGLDAEMPGVSATAAAALGGGALDETLTGYVDEWLIENRHRLSSVAPLLRQAAEAQRVETVLAWVDGTDPEDADAWYVGLDALSYLAGLDALDRLTLAAENPSEPVAETAADALAGRWTLDQQQPETHETYYRIWTSLVANPRPVIRSIARTALADSPLAQRAQANDIDLSISALPEPEPMLEAASTIDWSYLARLGRQPHLELETARGVIRIALATESAPLTVQTVARLAEAGSYDGVPVHRLVPLFMAQTGDVVRGDGTGDPGFSIRTEITSLPFDRGVVGMASLGARDTENSQFFMVHSEQLHLDREYTAFGWVAEGMDVVDRLERGDRLVSVRVVPDVP